MTKLLPPPPPAPQSAQWSFILEWSWLVSCLVASVLKGPACCVQSWSMSLRPGLQVQNLAAPTAHSAQTDWKCFPHRFLSVMVTDSFQHFLSTTFYSSLERECFQLMEALWSMIVPLHWWSEGGHCLLAEIWKSDSAGVCQAQFIGGLRIDIVC